MLESCGVMECTVACVQYAFLSPTLQMTINFPMPPAIQLLQSLLERAEERHRQRREAGETSSEDSDDEEDEEGGAAERRKKAAKKPDGESNVWPGIRTVWIGKGGLCGPSDFDWPSCSCAPA